MESHEVLKEAMEELGVKKVAAELGLSTSLLYKWCQEPSEEVLDGHSGVRNPLDRLCEILDITGDRGVVSWLCGRAGGVFVLNPQKVRAKDIDATVIGSTQLMLREFSDVLDEVSRALGDGMGIDLGEAKRIRREWDDLKAKAEAFVMACEAGSFEK